MATKTTKTTTRSPRTSKASSKKTVTSSATPETLEPTETTETTEITEGAESSTSEISSLASRLGFNEDAFEDTDGYLSDATSEYAITGDGGEYSAAQDEPTADLESPSTSSSKNHAHTTRTVRSKGSEKADFLYELKRARESVWYRLRKAGFTPARIKDGVAGFRLDTESVSDSSWGQIRVTYWSPAVDKPSETDPKYFEAVDQRAYNVDKFEALLQDAGFTTEHQSVVGIPYVVLSLRENPVTKSDAPWNSSNSPTE